MENQHRKLPFAKGIRISIPIAAILFGIFGLIGGVQSLYLPKMLETYNTNMQKFESSWEGLESAIRPNDLQQETMNPLHGFVSPPSWYGPFILVLGVLGIFIAFGYIVSSILLLRNQSSADRFLFWFIICGVGLGLIKTGVSLYGGTQLTFFLAMGSASGMMLDGLLLGGLRVAYSEKR